jgi:hypothetical protein
MDGPSLDAIDYASQASPFTGIAALDKLRIAFQALTRL